MENEAARRDQSLYLGARDAAESVIARHHASLVAELRALAKTGRLVFSRDLTAILDAHEKESPMPTDPTPEQLRCEICNLPISPELDEETGGLCILCDGDNEVQLLMDRDNES